MEWVDFLSAFSSGEDFWKDSSVLRNRDYIDLMNTKDGTTSDDLKVSNVMVRNLRSRFGRDVEVLSEESPDCKWSNTGFVIDPIDGSWNYFFDFPAYCRIVSYLENGKCLFFSIYNEVTGRSICSNGSLFLEDGKEITPPFGENPIITLMYNTHYSLGIRRSLLGLIKALMDNGKNIRILGSPGFDLYCLITGAVGGVINLSPHKYDSLPIIDCLKSSNSFGVKKISLSDGAVGNYIFRMDSFFDIEGFI